MKQSKWPWGPVSRSGPHLFTRTSARTSPIGSGWFPRPVRIPGCAPLLALILVIMLARTGTACAQQDPVPAEGDPTTAESPSENTPLEGSAEEDVWPPPFNPSEEIGADAQISFPTDI